MRPWNWTTLIKKGGNGGKKVLTQLIEKETLAQLFSFEFCEISKNTFVTEHLRTTALYISSSRNKVADKESRKLRDNLERSLKKNYLKK